MNVNDLKDMLASLPQFQTQREQFSLHLDMAQECMNIFEKKRLAQVGNVEQCCATGYTAEGKTPKSIVEEMVPLLDDRLNITSLDKVRIMALYILFRDGVADEDRRRLYQHARLSLSEQDMVNNLVHLGVKVIKDNSKSSKSRIKQKPTMAEGEYELSRYKPVIQMMLEEQSSNKLDLTNFPYIKDMPPEANPSLRASSAQLAASSNPSGSLRSARPTWHKAPSARINNTEGKQRFIIFIAGGMTYSEMRCAYTVGQALGKDVYIGSTHVLTPETYCAQLRALGRSGVGSNPPTPIPLHPQGPGRMNRQPGQPVSYQEILNFRHWRPPVGPPSRARTPETQPQLQPKQNSRSSLTNGMSSLSLTSTSGSKDKKEKQEGEKKKKKLFGLKL